MLRQFFEGSISTPDPESGPDFGRDWAGSRSPGRVLRGTSGEVPERSPALGTGLENRVQLFTEKGRLSGGRTGDGTCSMMPF